jgi:hypothetical protein
MNNDTSKAKSIIFLANLFLICMIAREFWRTNHEFYPVDIIPPWFSMLIYDLGDEQ